MKAIITRNDLTYTALIGLIFAQHGADIEAIQIPVSQFRLIAYCVIGAVCVWIVIGHIEELSNDKDSQ